MIADNPYTLSPAAISAAGIGPTPRCCTIFWNLFGNIPAPAPPPASSRVAASGGRWRGAIAPGSAVMIARTFVNG